MMRTVADQFAEALAAVGARLGRASLLGVLLLCLCLAKPAAADPVPFIIEPANSKVAFGVTILGVTSLHGRFRDFCGRLLLDHAMPSRSSITFDIHTASADTGSPERDAQLKDAEFLNS